MGGCIARTVVLLILGGDHAASAADPETPSAQIEASADQVRAAHGLQEERGRSFVVLPIPQSSPALGSGLALAAVAFYRPQGSARPWMSGAGAMYMDSRSRAAGVFQKAYLGGDRYRATLLAGVADLNLHFYGIGSAAGDRDLSIPIQQKGNAIVLEGLMKVGDSTYAGVRLRSLKVDTTFELPNQTDLLPPQIELDSRVVGPGIVMEYDTRDNEQNPHRGWFVDLHAMWALDAFGSDFEYDSQKLAINRYVPMGSDGRKVLALRGSLCRTGADAPFFGLCMFGSSNDLRGYEAGRFRDHAMVAAQAEYRWRFRGRWGAVAFAGVGGVARSFSDFDGQAWLPAGGVGLRFQASKAYDVNVSVDYAVGKDGSDALYVYIGEAF